MCQTFDNICPSLCIIIPFHGLACLSSQQTLISFHILMTIKNTTTLQQHSLLDKWYHCHTHWVGWNIQSIHSSIVTRRISKTFMEEENTSTRFSPSITFSYTIHPTSKVSCRHNICHTHVNFSSMPATDNLPAEAVWQWLSQQLQVKQCLQRRSRETRWKFVDPARKGQLGCCKSFSASGKDGVGTVHNMSACYTPRSVIPVCIHIHIYYP